MFVTFAEKVLRATPRARRWTDTRLGSLSTGALKEFASRMRAELGGYRPWHAATVIPDNNRGDSFQSRNQVRVPDLPAVSRRTTAAEETAKSEGAALAAGRRRRRVRRPLHSIPTALSSTRGHI